MATLFISCVHKRKNPSLSTWIYCLWATKKIFLLFLRMNSNPHHNCPVRKKPYFTRFFIIRAGLGGSDFLVFSFAFGSKEF